MYYCYIPPTCLLFASPYSSTRQRFRSSLPVIIRGVHPYQKAIPASSGNGTEDYTSWKFIDNPSYTTIKSGQNKITAKYSCMHNSDSSNAGPSFVKFHSVNVTGI